MPCLERMQAPASGLAYALDQTSRLSAQTSLSLNSLDKATARSEQQKAITSLLNEHDDSIFAYLRFARSLGHSLNGHGSLSNDQVLAVQALSHYDDDEIRTWLGQARKICETEAYFLDLQELIASSKPFHQTSTVATLAG